MSRITRTSATASNDEVRKLRGAVTKMDRLSHEAFSEILMLARCALVALAGPESPRVANATEALQAIARRASEADNDINAIAEAVGCDHVDGDHPCQLDAACAAARATQGGAA